MNIVKLFIALVLLAVCTQTSAQSINKLKLEKFIDSIYKPFGNKNSPGCAVTIMENGKLISKKTYGMASIELQVPFSHQTVVKIGYSEAREFISIAAVLMEKDGILSLNDKVRQYFPKLPEWSTRLRSGICLIIAVAL
jgi:CubicO group peptidase (beta-lactamase class C family)